MNRDVRVEDINGNNRNNNTMRYDEKEMSFVYADRNRKKLNKGKENEI